MAGVSFRPKLPVLEKMFAWLRRGHDKFEAMVTQKKEAAKVEHSLPKPVEAYYAAHQDHTSLKAIIANNCFFFRKSSHNLRARDPREGELLFCPTISDRHMRVEYTLGAVETCVETECNVTFAATGYIHYISDHEAFHEWRKFANNDVVAWYHNKDCTEMIGLFRETLVFQKQEGWKLIHSHVSLALA